MKLHEIAELQNKNRDKLIYFCLRGGVLDLPRRHFFDKYGRLKLEIDGVESMSDILWMEQIITDLWEIIEMKDIPI